MHYTQARCISILRGTLTEVAVKSRPQVVVVVEVLQTVCSEISFWRTVLVDRKVCLVEGLLHCYLDDQTLIYSPDPFCALRDFFFFFNQTLAGSKPFFSDFVSSFPPVDIEQSFYLSL